VLKRQAEEIKKTRLWFREDLHKKEGEEEEKRTYVGGRRGEGRPKRFTKSQTRSDKKQKGQKRRRKSWP